MSATTFSSGSSITTTKPLPSPATVGDGILRNFYIFLAIGILLFFLFCWLRKVFKDMYSQNTLNTKIKLSGDDKRLRRTWLQILFYISDDELLPWVGLDGFILLQTYKLFLWILLVLSVPAIFLMAPLYFWGSKVDVSWFERLTMMGGERKNKYLWVTIMFNYFIAAVVFYSIYSFYRNLTIYRQVFLHNPGCCVSQVGMRRLSRQIGSVDGARRLIDLTSKSVIITNVCSKYTKREFKAILDEMLGDGNAINSIYDNPNTTITNTTTNNKNNQKSQVESLVIVQNRRAIKKLLEQRNDVLEELEEAFRFMYDKIIQDEALKVHKTRLELLDSIHGQKRIDYKIKNKIMSRFIEEPSLLKEFRPLKKEKVHPSDPELPTFTKDLDAIKYYYSLLIRLDEALVEAARRFATDIDDQPQKIDGVGVGAGGFTSITSDYSTSNTSNTDESVRRRRIWEEEDIEREKREDEEIERDGKSLVSVRQFLKAKDNLKDYSLTMWGSSMSVIVQLQSKRSASICSQALLSSRPLSMEAKPAPTADDIIWPNLYLPAGDRFTRELLGELVFIMVLLFFTMINAVVSTMLDMAIWEKKFDWLHRWFLAHPTHKQYAALIVAPLFTTAFMALAPFMLLALTYYQGKASKTEVQLALARKFTWLLFLQTFFFVIFSDILTIIDEIKKNNLGDIIDKVRKLMPTHAAYFMNMIIQKGLLVNFMDLIRPDKIGKGCLLKGINKIRINQSRLSPIKINLGCLYPLNVVYVLMLVLCFLPICPIICLSGLIFYGIGLLVQRHNFLFCNEVAHEGGGLIWIFVLEPVMVGCIVGQIFSMIELVFFGGKTEVILMIPLLIMSVWSIFFLRETFERRSTYIPLCDEVGDKVRILSERMTRKQNSMVNAISREVGEHFRLGADNANSIIRSPTTMTTMDGAIIDVDSGIHTSELAVDQCCYESVPFNFQESNSSTTTQEMNGIMEMEFMHNTTNPYCNPIVFKRHMEIMLPPQFFHIIGSVLGYEREELSTN